MLLVEWLAHNWLLDAVGVSKLNLFVAGWSGAVQVPLSRVQILGRSCSEEDAVAATAQILHGLREVLLLLLLLVRLQILFQVSIVLIDQVGRQASLSQQLQQHQMLTDVVLVDVGHQPVELLATKRPSVVDFRVSHHRSDHSFSIAIQHIPGHILQQLRLHEIAEQLHQLIGPLL